MWFRILILALGTFAIGTDGFVIAGILPSIAHDLGMSIALTGLSVTAFSLAYALGSPLLATLTGSLARRQLLLLALVSFVLANVLAAVATNFAMLLVARVIAALSAALYTPSASTVAAFLAPEQKRGQALSLVTAGLTVATVVGVPLGILIGTQWNWRITFVLVALLGVIAFVGVLALFPPVANLGAVSLRTRLALLRRPVIGMILANTVVWILGSFTLYTYLSPFLLRLTHLQGASISIMFLVFGVASVIGNVVGGYGADHWGAVRIAVCGLLVLIAAFFILPLVSGSLWGVACVIGVWGVASWSLIAPQQHRLIAQAPEDVNIVLSLNSSAIYIGVGAAAALGGQVVQYLSPAALGWVSGIIESLALVILGLSVWLARGAKRQRVTEQVEEQMEAILMGRR